MTIREELEMLRQEVEELKRRQSRQEETVSAGPEELFWQRLEQAGEKAGELKDEVKEQLHELAEQLKDEYESLSPAAAVLLFALGAMFGRSLASK
jgi:predicted transcriptional regulator